MRTRERRDLIAQQVRVQRNVEQHRSRLDTPTFIRQVSRVQLVVGGAAIIGVIYFLARLDGRRHGESPEVHHQPSDPKSWIRYIGKQRGRSTAVFSSNPLTIREIMSYRVINGGRWRPGGRGKCVMSLALSSQYKIRSRGSMIQLEWR
jgi:hypothetical protein